MSEPGFARIEVIAWGGDGDALPDDMALALRQQDYVPDTVTAVSGGLEEANAAGRASRADILVFWHVDVRPHYNWLRRLIGGLVAASEASIAIPRLLGGGTNGWRTVTTDGRRMVWSGAAQAGFATVVAGAQPWADARCLAVRRHAFAAAQGFDVSLGLFAGADLLARVGGAPQHAVAVPAARAVEIQRPNAADTASARTDGLVYWARRAGDSHKTSKTVLLRARERRDAISRVCERLGSGDRARIERRISRLDQISAVKPATKSDHRRPARVLAPIERTPLRFCFVLPGYAPAAAGRSPHDAGESFGAELARGLVAHGHVAHVIRRALTPVRDPRWDAGVWLHDAPRLATALKLENVPVLEGWPASIARCARQVCAPDGMDLIVTSVSSNAADAVSAACRSDVLILGGPRGPAFLARWDKPWKTMATPGEGLEAALDWICDLARNRSQHARQPQSIGDQPASPA